MSHLRSKTHPTASNRLCGRPTRIQHGLRSNVDRLSLFLPIPSSGVLPVPPPLLCSLPPPPVGSESSAAASARSCAELAEDAAAGLQAHGGRTKLRQWRMTDATARLPVADGRDRALLPPCGCLRLPRDGRTIRPKPAVFSSRRPSRGERASSPLRLARPAHAPKALLAVASFGLHRRLILRPPRRGSARIGCGRHGHGRDGRSGQG